MQQNRQFQNRKRASSKTPLRLPVRIGLFLSFCILFFIGCSKPPEKAYKKPQVNVRVLKAEKRPLRPFLESVGSLAPRDQVSISSELDGILEKVHVDEGSAVKTGQLIAEIRSTDYLLALDQAAAQLYQAETNLANTRLEYQRKESLYREELLTRQQFDDISARVKLAEAEKARAKAGLSLAEERVAKTKIFSSLSGSVKGKKATAGDYVRNGSLLATLVRTDQLKLTFSVSEKDIGALRLGQDVVFVADPFPERRFSGRLTAINPSLDERTRSLKVEALVPNTDGRLKPGIFVRATLYTGPARQRVLVPITALLYDNSATKLFVVEGEKARERKVQTGGKYGEFMEIIAGVSEGENIVTAGQNNLMEGVSVHVAR